MLEPAPFNNTYGIFVRREVAEEYNLHTLADLAEASLTSPSSRILRSS